MILNFAFAIPEMLGLLVNGLESLLGIDANMFVYVQIFASVLMSILYVVGIIELLTNIRSGRAV
jgi:hypothetical protein